MNRPKKRKQSAEYLTKRILESAATAGFKEAARETMEVMGFVVIADNGWIVKKHADGSTERISKIETVNRSAKIVLD
jgi:hypothetical protein